MMERLREQMMIARAKRLKEVQKLREEGKRISQFAAKELAKSALLAREYNVVQANVDEYEVRSRESECFPVHLDVRTCVCGRWRYSGIPCAHAVAAITFARLDVVDFVDHRFKVEAFEATYRLGIHAMSTVNL
ncbi:hypothetical protein V1504DRAFT_453307, partial [Lipomyces starkeyi]